MFVRFASAVVVLIVLAILIGIAEFTARMLGLGDPLLYRASVPVGYSLQPGQVKTRRRGAVVTIDSQGLRSLVDWSESADYRILFVGDSVTYGGSYIDDSELFSEEVCRELRDEKDLRVTCGNAGTNAYGVDNMRARLRYSSIDNEDLIVVTLIASDAVRGMQSLHGLPYFSREPPNVIPALTEVAVFILDTVRSRIRFGKPVPRTYDDKDLDVARESVSNLIDTLVEKQRQGKQVLLVYSPVRLEIEGRTSELQEVVFRYLQESSIPFIDMRTVLQEEDLDKVYFDEVHLDVYGHELFGREIARRIRELTDRF